MITACLLLKAPRPGLVKTRLARDIGIPRATAIYRALVERQLRALPRNWTVAIHHTPPDATEEMSAWLAPILSDGGHFIPQCEGDLGARLTEAMRREFSCGAHRLFLLGGDCPGLNATILQAAHIMLDHHDLVLGPATDGGYVLLGLKAPQPALFQNIAWSTSEVLTQTLAAAQTLGLRTAQLPPLEDVDDEESLQRQSEFLHSLKKAGM